MRIRPVIVPTPNKSMLSLGYFILHSNSNLYLSAEMDGKQTTGQNQSDGRSGFLLADTISFPIYKQIFCSSLNVLSE